MATQIHNSYQDYDFGPEDDGASTGPREQIDLEKYSKPVDDLKLEVTPAMEKEYKDSFERNKIYKGNEVYSVLGLYGTNMKQLFLMYCLLSEDLKMADFAEKMTTLKNRRAQSDPRDMGKIPTSSIADLEKLFKQMASGSGPFDPYQK